MVESSFRLLAARCMKSVTRNRCQNVSSRFFTSRPSGTSRAIWTESERAAMILEHQSASVFVDSVGKVVSS